MMLRWLLLLIPLALVSPGVLAQEPEKPRLQIPPAAWKVDKLADLKLKAIRLNVLPEELRLLVEFTETVPSYELLDIKRRLNQDPITVNPYFLAFLNEERRVRTLPIAPIRDEITGRKDDRFEILFKVPKALIDFAPVEAEVRAP